MANARSPSLLAPAKASRELLARFDSRVHKHPAIQADPLLMSQALWLRGLLDDFAVLTARRAKERAGG